MSVQQTVRPANRTTSIPTQKWIRARFGGSIVADSRRARIVHRFYPRTYAFPADELAMDVVGEAGEPQDHPVFGPSRPADVRVGDRVAEAAVWFHDGDDGSGLQGHASIQWGAMDAWYEEERPVYMHPHDPQHRIDVRPSRRRVQVKLEGEVLADTQRPVLLFETGLPTRYYIPPLDVRWEHLRPSEKTTGCAYKGTASYHDVHVGGTRHEGLVWEYRSPFAAASAIQGMPCFFQERLDLVVDGEAQERPKTPWS